MPLHTNGQRRRVYVADERRHPPTEVHGSESLELGARKLAVGDRDEVEVASSLPERTHAGRADDVEPIDAPWERTVQPPQQVFGGLRCRGGQEAGGTAGQGDWVGTGGC